MNAIAHNKAFAKKVGVSQSVGKDFAEADKGKKFKQGGEAMGLKKLFRGKEGKTEEMREAKALRMGAISPKEFVKGEKSEGHKEENSAGIAKKIKSGKMSPAAYAKMEASEKYSCGGKVKKMAVGGNTGSFNSTGSNPYLPATQTGAIGGLDQLNQSLGTIKNALGGSPPNVGESNQMYKKGGKVKKMADGGMPVDPRAAAMAAKRMPMGAKRGAPIADPRAMAAATQRGVRGLPAMGGTPQGKPMVGRMPPQANMPVPTMKKGGGVEIKGKTKGKIVKMARGGGCEVKGKTKGKMITMKKGGAC